MNFSQDITPRAFEALSRPDIQGDQRDTMYWRTEALRSLKDEIASHGTVDLDDALVWAGLEDDKPMQSRGSHGSAPDLSYEVRFATTYNQRHKSVAAAIGALTAPGSVSLIINSGNEKPEVDEFDEEMDEPQEKAPFSALIVRDVINTAFILPSPAVYSRRVLDSEGGGAGVRPKEPVAILWSVPPAPKDEVGDYDYESDDFEDEELRAVREDFAVRLSADDQHDADWSDILIDPGQRSGASGMNSTVIPLRYLYNTSLVGGDTIDDNLIDAIVDGKPYVVTDYESAKALFLALDPTKVVIPDITDISDFMTKETYEELRNSSHDHAMVHLIRRYYHTLELEHTTRVVDSAFMKAGDLPYLYYTTDRYIDGNVEFKEELYKDRAAIAASNNKLRRDERRELRRGLARLLRNPSYGNDYSDETAITQDEEFSIAVEMTILEEREESIGAIIDRRAAEIVESIISNQDHDATKNDIEDIAKDTLQEVFELYKESKYRYGLSDESGKDIRQRLNETVSNKLFVAIENLQALNAEATAIIGELELPDAYDDEED